MIATLPAAKGKRVTFSDEPVWTTLYVRDAQYMPTTQFTVGPIQTA
jgi:hypothetical protein